MIRPPFGKHSTTPSLNDQLRDIWSEVQYQEKRWSWLDSLKGLFTS